MQENTQVSTTPPLSGPDLVTQINNALQTIATDFSGAIDPASKAWSYCTWADTGNMLRKERNAANSVWVTLGPLLTEMAVKTGDAAQTFKVAPSTDPAHAVAQSQAFGVDQTWQDVTSSRTLGASYVNSTEKPIIAHIEGTANAVNASVVIQTEGVYYMGLQNANSAGFVYQATAIILPGETYLYTITAYASYLIREYR